MFSWPVRRRGSCPFLSPISRFKATTRFPESTSEAPALTSLLYRQRVCRLPFLERFTYNRISRRGGLLSRLCILFVYEAHRSFRKLLPFSEWPIITCLQPASMHQTEENLSCKSAFLPQNMSVLRSWMLPPLSPRLLRRAQ